MTSQDRIAHILLELKAVVLSPNQPFTWASGLKSPIYCDNRLLISAVPQREEVIQAFLEHIATMNIQPDVIAGCATAGIPHAAWVADRLNLPMIYVRGSEKKHGRQNRIEGQLHANQSVLVIEDLISTGGSAIDACNCITEKGNQVLGVLAVFQYGMAKAEANFKEANLSYDTLSNLSALLDVAKNQGYLTGQEFELLENWRFNPKAWSDRHGS